MKSDNHTGAQQTRHDMIPEPTLQRLPWYLAYVSRIRAAGVEHVSSTQISRDVNVVAAQIAKDLSYLNIRGRTRIGYEVAELERVLSTFLGFGRLHRAIIIGVGSLGGALMQDSGLNRFGLKIVAGFDINPAITGTHACGIPIFKPDQLPEKVAELKAEIAIITVPDNQAQLMADFAALAGIKALWNFTPVRLREPQGAVVQDTSIYAHLAMMYNRMDNLLS